jgi:hypothetical protein
MGFLILLRKDSRTRNCFLGESSGPYIWGRGNVLRGVWGVKGSLERWFPAGPESNLSLCGTAEAVPFHGSGGEKARRGNTRSLDFARDDTASLAMTIYASGSFVSG